MSRGWRDSVDGGATSRRGGRYGLVGRIVAMLRGMYGDAVSSSSRAVPDVAWAIHELDFQKLVTLPGVLAAEPASDQGRDMSDRDDSLI